jgi:anti-sigma-K factor RskA
MTREDCEIHRDLLAAQALTALDTADARALESHLESCADCRSEMSAWQETAAPIALDAKPLEPSAQLRERILASVRAEGRATQLSGDLVETRQQINVSSGDSRVLAFERPRRDVWASLRSFGAIAATLVIGALIISLLVLWQQNRAAQEKLAKLSVDMTRAKTQLDHERAVVALLTSPDAHMVKLAGTKDAPDAHAMLAYDKSGHAMLMARGLPTAPKGMAYQLWYIKDNKKMPGKLFTPDDAGNGILEDEIPSVARDAAVFAITLEPESGVQVPTGSIYLLSAS